MGTTEVHSNDAGEIASVKHVDTKLEVVVIPVSDVNRAKEFYGRLGWRLDADFAAGDDFRIVQFTPSGSACSIQFGTNVTSAMPGSAQSLYLIVSDIEAARQEFIARGVEVGEVFHERTRGARFGTNGRVRGPAPDHESYRSFASFSDPDGNGWLFQEVTARLPGRIDSAATSFGSASDLASALRRVAAAHGEHEQRTGQRHENWPDWYAAYMVAEQAGTRPLPAGSSSGRSARRRSPRWRSSPTRQPPTQSCWRNCCPQPGIAPTDTPITGSNAITVG